MSILIKDLVTSDLNAADWLLCSDTTGALPPARKLPKDSILGLLALASDTQWLSAEITDSFYSSVYASKADPTTRITLGDGVFNIEINGTTILELSKAPEKIICHAVLAGSSEVLGLNLFIVSFGAEELLSIDGTTILKLIDSDPETYNRQISVEIDTVALGRRKAFSIFERTGAPSANGFEGMIVCPRGNVTESATLKTSSAYGSWAPGVSDVFSPHGTLTANTGEPTSSNYGTWTIASDGYYLFDLRVKVQTVTVRTYDSAATLELQMVGPITNLFGVSLFEAGQASGAAIPRTTLSGVEFFPQGSYNIRTWLSALIPGDYISCWLSITRLF